VKKKITLHRSFCSGWRCNSRKVIAIPKRKKRFNDEPVFPTDPSSIYSLYYWKSLKIFDKDQN
jgi:hypothetical protein